MMNNRKIENLLRFILHNKTLTRAQQIKRDALLARDYSDYSRPKVSVSVQNNSAPEEFVNYHKPKDVIRFLKRFSGDGKVKFTTHIWDKNEIADFDDFCKQYSDEIHHDPLWKDLYHCNSQLYWLIYNYLLNDGSNKERKNYFWSSKYHIKVGIKNPNGLISNWLKEHPDKQMFDMPLSEFKEGYMENGHRIRNEIPVYFNELSDLFKHCIEFRDSDFYYMIRRVFCNSDISVDKDSLKQLKGISFYSATELVEAALADIADNIRSRKENSTAIRIWRETFDGYNEFHILHVGSYALTEIDNDKLMLRNKDSQMLRIKRNLQSLCDFYITSRFIKNGEEVDARIEYLYDENANSTPRITYLDSGLCEGFECVLKFYR